MKRERLQQVKQLLTEKKQVQIQELCETFGISAETARRDLNALEAEGLARRCYGGAEAVDYSEAQELMPNWDVRFTRNLNEKKAIAREALRWIPDGSTIALDSGTSILEVAKLLNEKKNLTVLTNDLRIAAEISSHTHHAVYFIGGLIKKGDMITTGFLSTDFLSCFSQIDLSVLSTDGISIANGLTDYNVEMGRLKTLMVEKSKSVLVVADYSKFAADTFYEVCGIDRLSMVITDDKVPKEMVDALNSSGVKTVLAEV